MRRMSCVMCIAVALMLLVAATNVEAKERVISHEELLDKVEGYWIGQLLGNYIGFPFENNWVDEPVPVFVDRIYTYKDDKSLRIADYNRKGFIPIFCDSVHGAWSDDDTDIEFVTLHAVEKYGLDINYPEITQMWKTHINDHIWCANRFARDLMEKGLVAPDTGKKENNEEWFQIDPQLVNEIWSVFYPGMTKQAAKRAEWGARITNDDWAIHPTIAYGVMISAAFFEKDVEKLVQMAIKAIPNKGPYAEGIRDVVKWHKKYDNWRDTRREIHNKYYEYKKGDFEAPVSVVAALQNGLCGIMALLYGEGDYMKTVGIATSAGYDCDNQAATCAALIGVRNGMSGLGKKAIDITINIPSQAEWTVPFNNLYCNWTRDDLPVRTPISEIVERIAKIAKDAILENGGRMELRDDKPVYIIDCDF